MSQMKTAISMDPKLFRRVNELAEQMHVSRSKLVRIALEKMIKQRDEEELTRRFNEAYATPMDEEEKAFVEAAAASLAELTKDDKW